MTKVFIGGSRQASRLNALIRGRLDNIVEKEFPVAIGDANGADKAVQVYLHGKGYKKVEVFCSDGICRNNIGNWRVRNIPAGTTKRNVQFYSAKDRIMAEEATVGLMVWDGRSVGTLLNVYGLLSLRKKVVLYSIPEKRFFEFKASTNWHTFIAARTADLRQRIEDRIKHEGTSQKESAPMLFASYR